MKRVLRRLDRGPETIQFGVHPARAVVLTEVAPAVRRLLDRLDGTCTFQELLAGARRLGLDAATVRQVLDLLAGQGVIEDAGRPPGPLTALGPVERDRLGPDLDALALIPGTLDGGLAAMARRRLAQVRVYGAGRVGAQVAALLAAAGVGHLCVIDPGTARPRHLAPGGLTPAELGRRRDEGAVAVARRLAPGVHAWTGRTASQLGDRSPGPDLVVLVPVAPLDGTLAWELTAHRIPHLAAAVVEGCGVVGPLVLPGRTACLHCMELTRRDRDPAWPAVAAGLGGLPLEESACDTVTAALVAAQAAEEALAFLDGRDGESRDGGNGEPSGGRDGRPHGRGNGGWDGRPRDGGNGEQTSGWDGRPHGRGNGEPTGGENGRPCDRGEGEPVARTVELIPGRRPQRRSWVRHPQCRCSQNYFSSLRMVA